MIILLTILWVVDRYAWNYTKQLGRYEDRQGDLDFIAKYSQANGPKINVDRLRKLATAGSSMRLFEVSDEDMAKSLHTMTQQKMAKKTQLLTQTIEGQGITGLDF